jgi:hypothetical protein
VTTDPSDFSAAKAEALEKIFVTPELKFAATDEESPPNPIFPQVTTEPSLLRAAKALSVEKTSLTPDPKLTATAEEFPP